ncbi:MAG: DUF2807 domain-containing protein [Imperialibacter sp.]|uniref:GIN domain-containing protein n=1 Tax=Imperialibacter sp. TaxID=2038411 RepID=UPI0032EADC38
MNQNTKVVLLATIGLVFIITSCEKDDVNLVPSAIITTTNFTASNISQLDVSDVFNVYVSFSETEESVQVEANENLHHLIEMKQSGNKLTVGLNENTNISGALVLNIYIKTATLTIVKADRTASIEFDNLLKTPQLELEINDAARVSGSIEVDDLVARLIGLATLDISGNSDSFDIDAAGASEMTGFDFATKNLKANLNGSCNISLTINQALDVAASGTSNVYYKGDGVVEKQNLKDTSTIIKLD